MTAQAQLQITLAQKGMLTSAQSAVTTLQDTTTESGHVKVAKHSLKEAFKVGESAFDNFAQISCFVWSGCAVVDLVMSWSRVLVYGALCWKETNAWFGYFIFLLLSSRDLEMSQSKQLISLEENWNTQHGKALQQRPQWDGTADLWTCLQFVSQSRHSNSEFVIIVTVRVGNCLQPLLAKNYSWQERIAWSCWVREYNISTQYVRYKNRCSKY